MEYLLSNSILHEYATCILKSAGQFCVLFRFNCEVECWFVGVERVSECMNAQHSRLYVEVEMRESLKRLMTLTGN